MVQIKKSYLKKLIKEELGKITYYPTFSLLGGARSKIWEQGLNPSELAEINKKLPTMKLREIAVLIKHNWPKIYFGAVPYLDALGDLDDIKDNYFQDSGSSVVAYFLANAAQWKGDVARMVKKELNNRLKGSRHIKESHLKRMINEILLERIILNTHDDSLAVSYFKKNNIKYKMKKRNDLNSFNTNLGAEYKYISKVDGTEKYAYEVCMVLPPDDAIFVSIVSDTPLSRNQIIAEFNKKELEYKEKEKMQHQSNQPDLDWAH